MAITKSATKNGFGFLILFAIPFAAVGVGVGYRQAGEFVAYWNMRSWVETPAKIVRAKLESHDDSDGGTTYQATAEYAYRYQGQPYTATRVAVHGGSDNIGSFQHDAHRQLSEHQQSGQMFRCYVNPANPSEAVLFRDLRWELLGLQAVFSVVFGSVGFGMLAFGLWSVLKSREERALTVQHPDEPWLCKKQWSDGKIKSSTSTNTFALLIFTLFWNLISAPIAFALRDAIFREGNKFVWIFVSFPAIGLLLIVGTIVSLLRWRKYGSSTFEMASVPGVIGGQLAGVVRVGRKIEPKDGFRLRLNCVQRVTTHGGENNNTSESVLWQDEQLIARDLLQNDPDHTAIPVLFQIPYTCRPTDESDTNSQTIWRLEVAAKTPSLDYSTSFETPVFQTPESDPNFVVDRSPIAQYVAADNPDRDLHEAGVLKTDSPTGEGFRLVFPMARHPGATFVFIFMSLVFLAVPIGMFFGDVEWWATAFGGTVFGLFGLVLLAASVDIWFYRSVVDVSARGLTIVGGLFGFGREQSISPADIKQITSASRMSCGQNIYYDIELVPTTGEKITVGKRILGKRLVDSVIRQIEQELGRT